MEFSEMDEQEKEKDERNTQYWIAKLNSMLEKRDKK